MKIAAESFVLENGVKIPKIGFGTWQIPNGEIAYNSVAFALKNGYRHIDTARGYGNEESVGKAVRDSGIDRSEIFITSKLPAEIKNYEAALKSFDETMENLGLDYIDLYLIHAPWPWHEIGADYTKENIEVWKAMEKIYESGRCRAIGVSNFNVEDLTAILETCKVKPLVNQIRYFIGYTQEEVTKFCQKNNILVEGYSPLATGAILKNETLAALAEKYNVSLPQLCIRYVLQKDVLPLPKSTHPEYIAKNAEVDFVISEEDMRYLDGLRDTV
ncbi:aldo/keto reductase [Clostridium thermarum]|uniref:aldo/keto reductase n=1 Tax=Clostridium thermarum TaxID=1716543 RepID=UPI0013D41512|nr:aldo/keto reductase [Clostridium thermarum]